MIRGVGKQYSDGTIPAQNNLRQVAEKVKSDPKITSRVKTPSTATRPITAQMKPPTSDTSYRKAIPIAARAMGGTSGPTLKDLANRVRAQASSLKNLAPILPKQHVYVLTKGPVIPLAPKKLSS